MRARSWLRRRFYGTPTPPSTPVVPLPDLVGPRTSRGALAFGYGCAIFLGLALVDETMNVVVGVHSARWDSVDGEIIGEGPELSSSGAMLKRPEVGIRYKYFVQPGDDDENKDEPGAGEFEGTSIYAVPRKGLLTSMGDFLHPPSVTGHHAQVLEKTFPKGSKVKVYYNEESPGRACLIPGLPYPDGCLRLPFYFLGTPFLMVLARSTSVLPVRFALFSLAVLVWTELSEEAETILFDYTTIGDGYTARRPK